MGSFLDQLFRSDARNTLVVKLNYWLSLVSGCRLPVVGVR
jgi:hypothetical protein